MLFQLIRSVRSSGTEGPCREQRLTETISASSRISKLATLLIRISSNRAFPVNSLRVFERDRWSQSRTKAHKNHTRLSSYLETPHSKLATLFNRISSNRAFPANSLRAFERDRWSQSRTKAHKNYTCLSSYLETPHSKLATLFNRISSNRAFPANSLRAFERDQRSLSRTKAHRNHICLSPYLETRLS
jgi:uncharacterized protein YozE (UPF0346 family)